MPSAQLRSYHVQGVRVQGFWDLGVPPVLEPFNFNFVKAVLMEAMATLLFLFICIGTIVNQCKDPANPGAKCVLSQTFVLNISLTFGVTIFVLVYASAAFSGGHLNPAISLALLVANKISVMRAVCYIIAQIGGATAGVGLVKAMNPVEFEALHGANNFVAAGTSRTTVWFMEAILTFLLAFMVLVATDSVRAKSAAHIPVLGPLGIGLSVFLACMVAVPIDGCSLNPARSFATAVISGRWQHQWLFVVGPLTGAIVAVLVYEIVYRPNYDAEDVKEEPSKEPIVLIKSRADSCDVLSNIHARPREPGSRGIKPDAFV